MKFASFERSKPVQMLLAGLFAGFCVFFLHESGVLELFESRSLDLRIRGLAKPAPTTDQVRLVFLDQSSLDWAERENKIVWPWPRELHAAVLAFCAKHGAKAVGFDVLFTEHSPAGVADDLALGAAIKEYGRFAQAAFFGEKTGSYTAWPLTAPKPRLSVNGTEAFLARLAADPAAYSQMRFPKAAFPIPEAAPEPTVLANVGLSPDHDGVYRRVRLFGFFDNKAFPSLALGVWMAGRPGPVSAAVKPGRFHVGGKSIPLDASGSAVLNYRGQSGTHKTWSAAAVIQSFLREAEGGAPIFDAAAAFKDKYVIYGFSAPGLFDLRPAPVSAVYPGAEIWATALDNLLAGDFLVDSPKWLERLCIFAAAFLGAAAVLGVGKAAWAVPAILGALLVTPFGAVTAYRWGFTTPLTAPLAATGLAVMTAGVMAYAVEGRQKRFLRSAFRQYLSPTVIEQLVADPSKLKLGGERRVLSIYFSDLQGFTSLSEGLDPEALTALLNDYLSAMTKIIMDSGGTVDKYEGDAVIAFWNAPVDQPDHADRAVRAALDCQAKLTELRPAFRERSGKDLFMRIGVNTGPVVVGNLGSHERFDYSMLGDAANLASRLEGVNKEFATPILISGMTLAAMLRPVPVRPLSPVAVVGRKEPVAVYEPLGEERARREAHDLGDFADALHLFSRGEFHSAKERFEAVADRDPVAAKYVEKCAARIAEPPADWNGVLVMTSK